LTEFDIQLVVGEYNRLNSEKLKVFSETLRKLVLGQNYQGELPLQDRLDIKIIAPKKSPWWQD
jgi:hypothetical protein